jgi:ABC-type dipeptide/oligopeptide/nickel transport system ATPase component
MKVVKHMCDLIAVMYKGELVETGSAEKILNSPEHSYTKKLIESML